MTAPGRSAALVVAGLAVASFAVVALTRNLSPQEEAAAPVTTAVPTTTTTTVTVPVEAEALPIADELTVVRLETPAPQIDGLSDTVSRVLAARGFAEMMGNEDPSGELADSVVKVLAARGVTLSVAEDGGTP
jgi:hypothetical protein